MDMIKIPPRLQVKQKKFKKRHLSMNQSVAQIERKVYSNRNKAVQSNTNKNMYIIEQHHVSTPHTKTQLSAEFR